MTFLKRTSTLFFIAGIVTLYSDTVGLSPGMSMGGLDIEANIFTDILAVIFIVMGIILLFKEKNNSKIKYSKCPKCEDTFTYSELEDGMCPKCNIKTIDMEKYYDKN